MKKFIKNIWAKHKLMLALIFVLSACIITLYRMVMYTYITVRFKEARPFHHHAPVFYKGHKVGKIVGVRHSKDYQHTLVKLVLYPHDLNLPENMTAKLKIIKHRKRACGLFFYGQEKSTRRCSLNHFWQKVAKHDFPPWPVMIDIIAPEIHPGINAFLCEHRLHAMHVIDHRFLPSALAAA